MKVIIISLIILMLNSMAYAEVICGKVKYITNKSTERCDIVTVKFESGKQTIVDVYRGTIYDNNSIIDQNIINAVRHAKYSGKTFCRLYTRYSIGIPKEEFLEGINNFSEETNTSFICGKVSYVINNGDLLRVFFSDNEGKYTDISLSITTYGINVINEQNMFNAALEALVSGEIFCRQHTNYSVGLEKAEFFTKLYPEHY